jgi:hypothetical protein
VTESFREQVPARIFLVEASESWRAIRIPTRTHDSGRGTPEYGPIAMKIELTARRLRTLSCAAGVILIILGFTGILGWVFDVAALKSVWPGRICSSSRFQGANNDVAR